MKPVPPSIDSVSFSCPHCGAHSDQFWFELGANETKDHKPPLRFGLAEFGQWNKVKNTKSEGSIETFMNLAMRTDSGEVFFLDLDVDKSIYCRESVHNLFLSKCYSCERLSVWVDKKIVYPKLIVEGELPNEDLPTDIKRDYNEARSILDASPRGAAALLRLSIQKLCEHLGETERNLNDSIASLVRKGLDDRIQRALDIVRVIGNEAVHPGQIDLRDDSATAARLFELVNLIADSMISKPKRIQEMYGLIPDEKKRAIEERDKKKFTEK